MVELCNVEVSCVMFDAVCLGKGLEGHEIQKRNFISLSYYKQS